MSFFSLPMVLPPTVVGFYLLLLLGPQGMIGTWLASQGLGPVVFTFPGLVIGSVIYSFPFAFQPIQAAFEAIGQRPLEVAATLRSSGWDSFKYITIPLAAPGVLRAAVLAFAHTVGEFGVVLMIGGGLPGKTKLVSVQLFEYVEGLDFQSAHRLSWVMVLFSFFAMWLVSLLDSKSGRAEG